MALLTDLTVNCGFPNFASLDTEVEFSGGRLIDLTDNEGLLCELPASIGNATALQVINLENNALYGAIPTEIGNLTALKTLWLKNNMLSGKIPSTVCNLTLLSSVTLSVNNLCPQ